jgi:glucose/arabinose dehydrogenase
MAGVLVLSLCLAAMVACDGQPPSPPPPAPTPQPLPGAEQIIGNERIGWDQFAVTRGELAGLRYLAYVDGAAGVELQDVSCGAVPSPSGFACTARLPTLSPGPHSLVLSAFVDNGTRIESPRSSPLGVVVVRQATSSPARGPVDGMILATEDGLRLRLSVIADGLDEPTDLAFAADGRVFVAERVGRVRVVRDGELLPSPAATITDARVTGQHGLLAMALDPDFARTRFAYAVYTAETGFRLVRFTDYGDTWGVGVVLMEAISPASEHPGVALRFGSDGRLYVGIDDGGIPEAAGDLGSYAGKVLRLNADATTPSDQAGGTPVFALDVNQPRGLSWTADGALWIVERERLHAIVADAGPERRGRTLARYALPEGTDASGLVFYTGGLVPAFQGNLFVAGKGRRDLLRLRFDPRAPTRIVSAERLLPDVFDAVRAVGVGRDGALYFCSSTALMRLAPDSDVR